MKHHITPQRTSLQALCIVLLGYYTAMLCLRPASLAPSLHPSALGPKSCTSLFLSATMQVHSLFRPASKVTTG